MVVNLHRLRVWIAASVSSRRFSVLAAVLLCWSCGGSGVGPSSFPITIHPSASNVAPGGAMTFFVGGTSSYPSLASLAWSAARGSIQGTGFGACLISIIPGDPSRNLPPSQTSSDCLPKASYTAPASSATDTVIVRLEGQSAMASVTVSAANWLGQPISISPSNGGTVASNTPVELQDVPFVATSPGASIVGCLTSDGATCSGDQGIGQPGDGPGLMTVAIPAPMVSASVPVTRIIVFMNAAGSPCVTPGCAVYSETLNVNFTVTP